VPEPGVGSLDQSEGICDVLLDGPGLEFFIEDRRHPFIMTRGCDRFPPVLGGGEKSSIRIQGRDVGDQHPTSSARLDVFLYRNIMLGMARAATTTDAFNAVAEPRRRQILDVLASGERPVNDLVARLGLAQPQVSKHLRVLREVGLVEVREEGRQRMYRMNGRPLKPIHDWVKDYERSWSQRFDRLDVVLEELKEKEDGEGGSNE
jgi:DNA-binding transcriptional ArsR family regulator